MEDKFFTTVNVIALSSCCMLSFLFFGTARLSSLMFIACLERYNTGRKNASLPFVLCYTVRNISGPFIGLLAKMFGSELVVIYGCIISTIGTAACFFAEDILTVTICWGLIFGFGFGLATVLLNEILLKYFKKHYGKANGIYYTGECFACFTLPIITEASLSTYGTSGTFLILSGLILHSIPCALILRKLEYRHKSILSPNSFTENISNQLSKSALDTENFAELSLEKMTEAYQTRSEHFSGRAPEKNIYTHNKKLNILENKNTTEECDANLKKQIHTVISNFQVFLDPVFIILFFTQGALVYVLIVFYTIVVDVSKDCGVEMHEEIYILIGYAVSDTVGRFTLCYIIDAGWMTKANFGAMSFILLGAVLECFAIFSGFIMMIMAVCLIGLLGGGLIVLSPSIVSFYVHKENIKMALAARYFLYPMIAWSQPYLIEYFREIKGSYNGLFFLTAAISFTCGVLTFLIPKAKEYREKR